MISLKNNTVIIKVRVEREIWKKLYKIKVDLIERTGNRYITWGDVIKELLETYEKISENLKNQK